MSEKRHDAPWGCWGKVRHVRYQDAEAHIARMKKARPRGKLDAYRCDLCGGFHVGRSLKRRRTLGWRRAGKDAA